MRLGRSSASAASMAASIAPTSLPSVDALGLPAVGLEPLRDVLRPGHRGRPVELDEVVVVEDDELAEPKVAGQARRLRGDPLLEVAVRGDDPRPVVDDRMARPGVFGGEAALGDGHADRVRQALAERSGGRLDARRSARIPGDRASCCPTGGTTRDPRARRRSRSGGGANRAACWRARRSARTGRGRPSPGGSGRGAGTGSTRRRPSGRRPSGRPDGRSSPSGRRRWTASGWCRWRDGRGPWRWSSGGLPVMWNGASGSSPAIVVVAWSRPGILRECRPCLDRDARTAPPDRCAPAAPGCALRAAGAEDLPASSCSAT